MLLGWAHMLCISSGQGLLGQRRDIGGHNQEEDLNCPLPSFHLQKKVGASGPRRPQLVANCEHRRLSCPELSSSGF